MKMNKDLVKINDGLYAVSDEEGNIKTLSIATKDKVTNDQVVELLKLENKIEYTTNDYNYIMRKLYNIKSDKITAGILNTMGIGSAIAFYFWFNNPPMPMAEHIWISLLPLMITESLNFACCGTILTRYFKSKELTKQANDLYSKISKMHSKHYNLEKSLGVTKEDFKSTKLKSDYAYKSSNNNQVMIDEDSKETHKTRVLKIR